MRVQHFFDDATSTLSYVVYNELTKDAVIIDPVLDFDAASGKTARKSLKSLVNFVGSEKLKLHYILETHAHADHLSGAHVLAAEYFPEAIIAIATGITTVQKTFAGILNLPETFATDGRQFGKLFVNREEVQAGSLNFKVLFTPGHTPACASYLFGDALFTGDSIFMPDSGTGRCDFPDGDAVSLFHSVSQVIYALPDATRIFVGHDYQPDSRKMEFESTVGYEKKHNIHIQSTTNQAEFVAFRGNRDKTLAAPKLLWPSIQINIAAGILPVPESNRRRYLKIPIS
jgi:glyoxylase-like metal-dependent hydrolase (beta-lactamase superfamily II)